MYTIYKTINTVNGRYYIGAHKTDDPNDSYLGSGLAVKRAVKYYGKDKFIKETLFIFDTEEEMYRKEKELIENHIGDPKCYNLMEGGIGGFQHINNNRHLYVNPMKDPEVVKKNVESRKKGYFTDSDRMQIHKVKRIENLQKAVQKNTGQKRPNHSSLMKTKSKIVEMWRNDRDTIRDLLSGLYEVTLPSGEVIVTKRLTELCQKHDVPFVTVWSNTKSNTAVSKGKAKGWKCKILNS